MKSLNPYFNFPGNSEEAFNFYKSVFGGEFLAVIKYKDMPDMSDLDKMSEEEQNKIMHIALPLKNGSILMATDVPESFWRPLEIGNNVYINIEADSADEADRIFSALSDGGKIEMALQKTGWSEKYGSCIDKFGIQWMVNYTGNVQLSV